MDQEPFRILVLGDFAARDHRGLSDAASLGARRVRKVDRDDLDVAIGAAAPELHLVLEPGAEPIVIRAAELDDFHPDHLVERVPDFQRLRLLRAQVSDPRHVPQAQPAPSAPAPSSIDAAAVNLSAGSVLDMILDADPVAAPPVPRDDDLTRFVRRAVQPHVVTPATADQQTLIDQVDGVITATMRVVLHHPRFQETESLWRGVSFLVRRLDTDESLQVYIADVTRSEIDAAVRSPDDAGGRALKKLLRGEGPGARGPWSLAIGAYSFAPDDLPLLASIAALARGAGIPWISAADARFAGSPSFAASADPDDWNSEPLPEWEAFRRTADARSIALALPRVLLRVPYGARSDECSALRFEETDGGSLPHDHYLWGNPAFLAALLCGEAAASGDAPPTHGTVTGLPLFVGSIDGLPEVTPVAEAALVARAVTRLLDRGLTALAAEREGDAVRIPRLQSVASPPAPLTAARAEGQ